jgi:hypothetical protein
MTRTGALVKAMGWQGGTIHQLAQETGVDVHTLLYAKKPSDQSLASPYTQGWFAGRTCTIEFNKHTNFPKFKGNSDFWLGVAEGLIHQNE